MIATIFITILGFTFLFSAWAKCKDLQLFQKILATYSNSNLFQSKIFSISIIVYEVLVAFLLLINQPLLTKIGLFLAIIFIICANLLLVIRLLRGDYKFRCGCGSSLEKEQNVIWSILKNFLVIILGIITLNYFTLNISIFSLEFNLIILLSLGLISIPQLLKAIWNNLIILRQWKVSG